MSGVLLAALLVAAAPESGPSAETPASIWRTVDDASVQHLQSGLTCPAALGAYRRSEHRAFDGFGFDVGCALKAPEAALTLYLTRTDKVDESYEMTKVAVTRASAALSPRLVAETQLSQDGLTWRRATYAFDGDTRSDIWVAPLHGWVLKYRVTYPAAAEASIQGDLGALTRAVQASAGARLEACAKSKAPKRTGRLIDPSGLMSSPIMLAALMSQGAAPDEPENPPFAYCVEEAFQAEGKGYLVWRGVSRDGRDAGTDLVTVMTVEPPPTLEIAVDEIGNKITERLSGRRQSRWIATMRSEKARLVYGYFDRRPSAQSTVPLLAKALSGEVKALGGLDLENKAILVGPPGE